MEPLERTTTNMEAPSRTSSTTLPTRGDDEPTFAPINTHASAISRLRRSLSQSHNNPPRKESLDPTNDPNLPYRTLSATANLDEYTVEVPSGAIPGPVEPAAVARKSGAGEDEIGARRYKLVAFTPNDPENPKNWSKAYKWWCTMVVALTCFVVAFASSVITADVEGVAREFNVSNEVALVSISVFVVGFGVGPMIFAPLSEIYGRQVI